MGRSSTYTPQKAAAICDDIADGNSLRSTLKKLGISTRTFFDWLYAHEDLAQRYARARESQAEVLTDELIALADQATGENSNAQRLKVDTRKWIASKILPRKYGDRVGLEHSGPDGGPIEVSDARDKLLGKLAGR